LQTTVRSEEEYWKNSYNYIVVAGYIDRPEGLLFQLAFLKDFGPDCRTVTLVNTSTVTIILCYCIILVIDWIISRLSIAFWEGDKVLFRLIGQNSNTVEYTYYINNSYSTGLTLVRAIYRYITFLETFTESANILQ
jgi:hypothetical protein